MVRGDSKSPKRKANENTASSSSTRNSRQKITDSLPEVGRRIKVYKNGEIYDQGITFVLNMRKTHDIGTFLDLVTSRIGLVQGAKRLYTLDGKLVKKTDELENGKEYVASSSTFTRLPYGKKKIERESSSVSTRSTSRSRASSTGPLASRSKSSETLTKRVKASNEKMNGNVDGGTYARSKSQVSLKAKAGPNPLPNGGAKIVTPVTRRAKKSIQDTTIATKKVIRDKAGNAIGATKTAATKIEKKVQKEGEKTKKQGVKGKKKVKETVKENGAVVEHSVGGGIAGAITAAEIVREKSPSPAPSHHKSKTPTPREKTPSPKESPRPKTAASRPTTAASRKHSEEEKSESEHRESEHEDSKSEEKEESEEERSHTASESEEETETEEEREDSEGSGRANTAASSKHSSRRASLKSTKSVKSHHG